MNTESLTHIFVDAFLINNFVLCVFLGMCSFLGLSAKDVSDPSFAFGGPLVAPVVGKNGLCEQLTGLVLLFFLVQGHGRHQEEDYGKGGGCRGEGGEHENGKLFLWPKITNLFIFI